MLNKKLVWGLIFSSLVLVFMTFKTQLNHEKEMEENVKIGYNIGCVVGTVTLLRTWSPDPNFFQLYCHNMSNELDMKGLMEFIGQLKENTGTIEE